MGITVFFIINDYDMNGFAYSEEAENSPKTIQLIEIFDFLTCMVFHSAFSAIRKNPGRGPLDPFMPLDGFSGMCMFKGSDYSYQLLISKRFYY